MKRIYVLSLFLCALGLLCPASASAVTINTVPVGDVGNANDPADGDQATGGVQNFGAVGYAYNIGKYEVTNDQYVEFLNNKDATGVNSLGLYSSSMTSDARGGINFAAGNANGLKYSAKSNMGSKPVNFVTWYDSVRFANWLNNGQATGDTETGAYTLEGGTPTPSNGNLITRLPGATWFLTSENEWYKAAYYDPTPGAGGGDNYWLYPTASDSVPTMATANSVGDISNTGTNVANYNLGADWNSQNGNVTTVGSAGPFSESFYDTSDQGGNVWEWNEALISGSSRGLRGGSWDNLAIGLQSSFRLSSNPSLEFSTVGFRVATVPEPGSLVLLACGAACLAASIARRRKSA